MQSREPYTPRERFAFFLAAFMALGIVIGRIVIPAVAGTLLGGDHSGPCGGPSFYLEDLASADWPALATPLIVLSWTSLVASLLFATRGPRVMLVAGSLFADVSFWLVTIVAPLFTIHCHDCIR